MVEVNSAITSFAPYENICPISGWTGAEVQRTAKNMFDEAHITWVDSKYIKSDGTEASNNSYRYTADYLKVEPSKTYGLQLSKITSGSLSVSAAYYDIGKNFISRDVVVSSSSTGVVSGTFTTPSTAAFVRINTPIQCSNIQLEQSAVTDYEQYNGTTIPITWPTAGTVYGGELDVTTGVLKAYPYYASYNGEALVGPWVSSMDKYVAGSTPTTGAQVVDFGGTPTTYQLTPQQVSTLLGENNIWADTGEVSVVYRADTQRYIQKLTGSTEEDMVANVNIASGKYFMVGGNLYLSTSAIAAGETIKPGTNCTATNMADALNALNV